MNGRKAWRRLAPRQEVGDPCEDCGTVLALCIQCGEASRCLVCDPYERPSAADTTEYHLRRIARDHPQAGLWAGAASALIPAMFLWAALTYLPDGTVRTLAVIAGTAACCAFLAMGAAMRKAPLPEEQPACRMREPTPDERWWCTALVALLVQVALVCVGMATG